MGLFDSAAPEGSLPAALRISKHYARGFEQGRFVLATDPLQHTSVLGILLSQLPHPSNVSG